MIDVNVYLSRWPCRRLPHDETPRLVRKLRSNGVTQAWAGSFDGLLHRDVAGVNARLVEECRQHGDDLLIPFGCVNPALPDWQEDLRRCAQVHQMPGVRLHPNYHGYELTDPRFAELLSLAADHGVLVQVALIMEDERTQHPQLAVPAVDPAPLPKLMKQHPQCRLMLLNAMRTLAGSKVEMLADVRNISLDIANLEGVGGLERVIERMPFERLCFGSYSPFFVTESAVYKLRESELGATIRAAITTRNAVRLLATD